jgi:hypothetical protein
VEKDRVYDGFIRVTYYIEKSGAVFIAFKLRRGINKRRSKPEKILGKEKSVFVCYPYLSPDDLLKELPYFWAEDTKIRIGRKKDG